MSYWQKSLCASKIENRLSFKIYKTELEREQQTELHVLRPCSKLIHEKYLLYFVKNQQFITDGVSTMKGTSGQQRVSIDFVANYLISLPPLTEQKRIVKRLDEILTLCDHLQKNLNDSLTDTRNFDKY